MKTTDRHPAKRVDGTRPITIEVVRARRAFLPSLVLSAAAILAMTAVAIGCGNSTDSPAAPQMNPATTPTVTQLTVGEAMVIVNGQTVNGMTMSPSQVQGTHTRFQAKLVTQSGPTAKQSLLVSYQRPQGMTGGSSGVMTLYDNGSHGDETPGDGIYRLDDFEGQYGFHMSNAQMGTYEYEFYGVSEDGHESNHMEVSVDLKSAPSQSGALKLSNARVIVNGQIVNGMTLTPTQTQGTITRFEARLMSPDGPATGQTVRLSYQRPQGMMCMSCMSGGGSGVVTLYDDGTHGDRIADDGIYCYEDRQGRCGVHMTCAPMGTYRYDFCAMRDGDPASNHLNVSVGLVAR